MTMIIIACYPCLLVMKSPLPSLPNTPAHIHRQPFIHFYYLNGMYFMSHSHIYIVFPAYSSISSSNCLFDEDIAWINPVQSAFSETNGTVLHRVTHQRDSVLFCFTASWQRRPICIKSAIKCSIGAHWGRSEGLWRRDKGVTSVHCCANVPL